MLKFDEAFYGILRQTSAIIAIVAMWLLAKQITEYSVAKTLFWIAIAGTILSLPEHRAVLRPAPLDRSRCSASAPASSRSPIPRRRSPFAQLSMIPLLTLTAYYAPAGHRATWFALMASLMNLALVAGQLQTKYLNKMYAVGRGDYGELGVLLITVTLIGLVVPVAAIAIFGRRV